ncbi:SDR family NAD(P)-dependent oxidoreductase [Labrenzia sp. 011]|uniref:SDR family NAD(P)-dependent oxidoreductase n=1 Tax=Labrenzia sp. 011 TaxID=2171494 RepID=UPI000D516854|nr:SDR family NAD(P)-dependent oxidoreductase [Labrenzia sp. 011]PVB60926.1 C-factor [Labrenzia sp. 011]
MAQDLAVVVGAGGGIGAALVQALSREGGFDEVVGLGRASDPPLDLLDEETVEACANRLRARGDACRLILDATGVLSVEGSRPEKSLRELDPAAMARNFAINAIGPALLMKHFLPLLPPTERCVFATLSARVGSIGDNRLGGWYSYRASKAALNQLVRTASVELRRRAPEAICVALHPGTVHTSLSDGFAKTGLDVQSAELAASRLVSLAGRLTPEQSGGFYDQFGKTIPW